MSDQAQRVHMKAEEMLELAGRLDRQAKNVGGCRLYAECDELVQAVQALRLAAQADVRAATVEGRALADIAAERKRQIEEEGWASIHDDQHDKGEMAQAAAAYALPNTVFVSHQRPHVTVPVTPRSIWPWSRAWWKPKDRRCDLIRAGALIVAEIDRLDRLSALAQGKQP